MLKLTVIGAVLVAATSGSIFKHKFAQKFHSSNTTTPQDILNDAEDYLEQEFNSTANALTDELIDCYDVNNDNYLSRDEFRAYVVNSLTGEDDCPARQGGLSLSGLNDVQRNRILSWTNGTSVTRIYQSGPLAFNKNEWADAIANRANIVVLGRTIAGAIVGGFTGETVMPSSKTSRWLTSPNMFIFNLKRGLKWDSSYSTLNIWINTFTVYNDLIDFGYHNALQFEYDDNVLTAKYTKNNDFQNDPTVSEFGLSSETLSLTSIEVYQVSY